VNKRAYNQLRKLDILFNPQARNAVEAYKEGREITLEQANITLFSFEVIKEPMNLNEAWNCSNKVHQKSGERQSTKN
jgi:hypothetical protein